MIKWIWIFGTNYSFDPWLVRSEFVACQEGEIIKLKGVKKEKQEQPVFEHEVVDV